MINLVQRKQRKEDLRKGGHFLFLTIWVLAMYAVISERNDTIVRLLSLRFHNIVKITGISVK
jgi:hypothetical protein